MKLRRAAWIPSAATALAVGATLVLITAPSLVPAAPDAPAATAPAAVDLATSPKIHGVCFVAGGRLEADPFAPLKLLGAEWISQTPFAWQRSVGTPSLRLAASGRIYWGETDEGIVETARRARAAGIRTLLNPHIWVLERVQSEAAWRGKIAMTSEADWAAWFAQYRDVILHYAALARESEIEALSIGTELAAATPREAEWRALIAEVRKIYPGRLTYGANWYEEAESVKFWDALDWIGVQAYYPLASAASPSKENVVKAWRERAATLESLASRFHRPIVLTEAGYRSQKGALVKPWIWRTSEPVDLLEQQLGFEALFETLWERPWFGGLFIWKWFPDGSRAGGEHDGSFTPQGKPAEALIRRWFLHNGRES